jgi:hypothetical protein
LEQIRRILTKVNLNELAFDFAIILMSDLFVELVFSKGIITPADENNLVYQHLIVLAEFIFAFVLAKEGGNFFSDTDKINWRRVYYIISSFYILIVAYISIPIILNAVGLFSYIAGFFACIFGAIAGIFTWHDDIQKHIQEDLAETNDKEATYIWEKYFTTGIASVSKDYPLLIGLPFLSYFYTIIILINAWGSTTGFVGILAL